MIQPEPIRILAALLAALVLAGGAAAEAPPELTTEEELGKSVFVRGENPSGREITAVLGEGGAEVSAALLPCASCHGEDGRGRPEGGLTPSDVTWPALTRPYTARHESGREHPPYDESSLKMAISMGRDPAGNELHVAMPRYRLSYEEANALVAYLKRLGEEPLPGVRDDELRLGVVLPPAGRFDAVGDAIRAVVQARLADLNEQGGLYSRRLRAFFVQPPEPPDERRAAVAAFLAEKDVFALCASFVAGADAELVALAEAEAVPLIGPFTARPQLDFPLNRQVFYVLSGYATQARALVDAAGARLEAPSRVLVVHPAGAQLEDVTDEAVDQGRRLDQERGTATAWSRMASVTYQPGAFSAAWNQISAGHDDGDVVVFLGSEGDARSLYAAASRLGWRPHVLLLQALSGSGPLAAAPRLVERTFVAFASLPSDYSPRQLAIYRRLAAANGLDERYAVVQLGALASIELLVEGLVRAGRELSRERLIAGLEELYAWETGLSPPLTFGPNRRVGAAGAYVVVPDPESRRYPERGPWIVPR